MFDTFGYAIQAYERMRMHDPTGPLADHSLMALGNAYFRCGQFENAAYNYDLLRKEYPNSKHQMSAHLLGPQAKMRVYQGAWYDGTALNDAKKIADQTLSQFGDKLGRERERVVRARAQIVEEQANREFTFAQYYDQHEDYRAARIYYQQRDRRFSQHSERQRSRAADGADQGPARRAAQPLRVADRTVREVGEEVTQRSEIENQRSEIRE